MKTTWMRKRILLALALLVPWASAAQAAVAITLDEAEALAFKNHRSIEQAEWARESARSQLSEIRRQTGPTLHWTSQARRIGGASYDSNRRQYRMAHRQRRAYEMGLVPEDVDLTKVSRYEKEYSNSLTLSIPLYTGGRLENRREAAGYGLNAADLAVENSRQEVRYSVRSAYCNVLKSRAQIKVRRMAVETLQEHRKQINFQLEAGAVAYSDLLATDVELANAELELVSEEGTLSKAIAALNNIIGLPVDTPLELAEFPAYQPSGEPLADCQDAALACRPDGIAAEFRVRQAKAAMDAAKSGYRPTVTAAVTDNRTGEYGFRKNHGQSWAAGLGLEWDVFNNGVTEAQVETAKANLRTAESEWAQKREAILLEVKNAYTDLATAEKSIRTAETGVRQAEEEYRIAQIRYVEGVDTNLAVMDAQEKLTRARTNYNTAFYEANDAKAALDKAMGYPVALDAVRYAAAVEEGKTSRKALSEAMFDETAVDAAAGRRTGQVRQPAEPLRTEEAAYPATEGPAEQESAKAVEAELAGREP